jgi:Domain of unknown function (DUF6268)
MRLVLLAGGLMVLGGMAFGDEKRVIQSPPALQEAGQIPLWSLDLKSDYTFGSRIMKAGDFGSQAEYHFDLDALRNLSLFGKYYLQIGVDHERFAFSHSNDIFPYAMSSVSAEIAMSYWTGDVFFPLLKLEPGIYFTRDYVTRNSLDIPMRVAMGIKINDNIYLVLGLAADPLAQTPALPIGGVNWKINDKLNFRAVFPKPRLSYIPNEALELFVAGEIQGGVFRNGPTNDRRTNNALLEYREYRTGFGASYTPKENISLEATAGWSLQRDLDYFRAGPDYKSKGAPYIKLEMSIGL